MRDGLQEDSLGEEKSVFVGVEWRGGGVDRQTVSQSESKKGKGRWTSNRNKGLMKWDSQ